MDRLFCSFCFVLSFFLFGANYLSWYCNLCVSSNSGNFQTLLLQVFCVVFFPAHVILLFSGTSVTRMVDHLILLHRSLRPSSFLKLFCLYVIQTWCFVLMYLWVQWLFHLSSPLLLISSSQFFISNIIFLLSQLYMGFSSVSYFCWDLLFHSFKNVCLYFIEHCYNKL